MPKNPEKFISSNQPKESGKLTPEEIKEMVKKYKEEHEGLLPEYFALPGEEKEEEREYPEELLIYYEMKEKLKPIEKGLKNETLRKNMIEKILSNIQEGQQPGDDEAAWCAFDDYSSLLSYLSHLYKIGQKKLAEIESQKAMHPEKKLPPIPEEKAF